ncbi:MAG: hypothetical protein M0C28_04375 [Candidatus Moduliflexus flocculans]|nr:hypothetical protein [Candidatus Moduliflexus flocculans]
MKVNVWNTILQLSKERSVEPRVIIQAIEESLRVASSKFFSQKENVQVLFKPEKGELRVFAVKRAAAAAQEPGRGDLPRPRPGPSAPTSRKARPSRSTCPPTPWAASPPRPPSRSSSRRSATPSRRRSSAISPRASARSSRASSGGSRTASSSSRSTGSRSLCPCARSCPATRSGAAT